MYHNLCSRDQQTIRPVTLNGIKKIRDSSHCRHSFSPTDITHVIAEPSVTSTLIALRDEDKFCELQSPGCDAM
jgi:hypothetical protein